jgi:hypothetical protein
MSSRFRSQAKARQCQAITHADRFGKLAHLIPYVFVSVLLIESSDDNSCH